MNSRNTRIGIVGGFFLFGIGLGFLLSPFLGLAYGMPAGIFIGVGIGVVVQQFSVHLKQAGDPEDGSSWQE